MVPVKFFENRHRGNERVSFKEGCNSFSATEKSLLAFRGTFFREDARGWSFDEVGSSQVDRLQLFPANGFGPIRRKPGESCCSGENHPTLWKPATHLGTNQQGTLFFALGHCALGNQAQRLRFLPAGRGDFEGSEVKLAALGVDCHSDTSQNTFGL